MHGDVTSPVEKPGQINCYLIPGLGATADIFERLELPDGIVPRPLEWVSHRKGERLDEYCNRLLPLIDQETPFILLGVSFGGAVAVELAKLCQPQKVFLVSSMPISRCIPSYLRWASIVIPYQVAAILPYAWAPAVRTAIATAFGPVGEGGRRLLYDQIHKTDPGFLGWAISALMKWDSDEPPANLLHIHGSADRILPLKYVKADVIIPHGGHFVIFTHGPEIGRIVSEKLGAGCFAERH